MSWWKGTLLETRLVTHSGRRNSITEEVCLRGSVALGQDHPGGTVAWGNPCCNIGKGEVKSGLQKLLWPCLDCHIPEGARGTDHNPQQKQNDAEARKRGREVLA